ncbi:hypothetical protein [Pelosinus sp. IPA-1]|uniref:hypothetical protein n=1 Tax=Pelosinus sp. IPA-1 TaxID=3029569 RepID=UPI0024361AEA|nr:hypothetical protein [Pelosinus sp. IPA-1]GMA98315.1 hypothetical protein PIPA1_11150 [Pelosinus sp. IPA-1]
MKKVIAVTLASLSVSLTSVAFAAPAELSGDVSVKLARETAEGSPNISGGIYTFKLKGETDLGAGWSLYGRLGGQYASKPSLGDFNGDTYGAEKKGVIAFDQFGVNYKKDQVVYKLGRQDATVGAMALLYSRSDSNIGKNVFVDGLSASGKVGVVDVSALFAKEDNIGSEDNKIYAIRTGFKANEDLSWGVTLGRYQYNGGESTNHWAADGTYKFGKNSVTAEFAKSSSNVDNKAYAASFNYGFNDKTAAYITNFRVETNGDMGGQSDFDNDNKGFYYGVTHKLSENQELELVYKDQKQISNGQHNTKVEATFTHSF